MQLEHRSASVELIIYFININFNKISNLINTNTKTISMATNPPAAHNEVHHAVAAKKDEHPAAVHHVAAVKKEDHKEPAVAHKEPVVAHKEPAVAHKEPAVAHKEPAVAHKEPAVAHKEPVAAHGAVHKDAGKASTGKASTGKADDKHAEKPAEEAPKKWFTTKILFFHNRIYVSNCFFACQQ